MFREIQAHGYRVRLDLSKQVLRLDAPEEREWSPDDSAGPREAPIEPRFPVTDGGCVALAALAEKAKQFDDGLYAAVEFAAQQGAGRFGGKAYMLKAVADGLARQAPQATPDGAVTTLLAAARLGDVPILPSPDVGPLVTARIDDFRSEPLRSKPIAFYTWSRSLEAIFQQDRMLQSELKGGPEIDVLVQAITADPRASATYDGYLQLVERLTNPLVTEKPDLRALIQGRRAGSASIPERGVYFFPPARAHETELIKRLFGDRPIPEGFDLADEMIRRIRDGRLDLTPTARSGWYDHQTWALVPLVSPEKTPEASRLRFGEEYSKQLVELFKGILARTRETHIKQLEIPAVGSAAPSDREPVVIHIRPQLSVEPLATYYLRRAEAYRFIRETLTGTFGPDGLAAMKMWTPEGPSHRSLAAELTAIERLFRGAHVTCCREIGLPPAGPPDAGDADAAAVEFAAWRAGLAGDAELGRDGRMMVPVFYDLQRHKTRVWVFLGWSTKRITVSYDTPPAATVFDAAGKAVEPSAELQLDFASESHSLPYPVMAEVYVTQILDRAEFAAHCEKHRTRKAILENLK